MSMGLDKIGNTVASIGPASIIAKQTQEKEKQTQEDIKNKAIANITASMDDKQKEEFMKSIEGKNLNDIKKLYYENEEKQRYINEQAKIAALNAKAEKDLGKAQESIARSKKLDESAKKMKDKRLETKRKAKAKAEKSKAKVKASTSKKQQEQHKPKGV